MYIKECILDISHHCNLPQKYTPVNPTIIVFIFIYKHIATLLNEWTMIVFFFFFQYKWTLYNISGLGSYSSLSLFIDF